MYFSVLASHGSAVLLHHWDTAAEQDAEELRRGANVLPEVLAIRMCAVRDLHTIEIWILRTDPVTHLQNNKNLIEIRYLICTN